MISVLGESRTSVTFGFVNEFFVPFLLRMTFTDRFIQSIHSTENKLSLTTPRRADINDS